MSAEKLGIPAVAVITDRFEASARAMAEANGLPDYPFAVIGTRSRATVTTSSAARRSWRWSSWYPS